MTSTRQIRIEEEDLFSYDNYILAPVLIRGEIEKGGRQIEDVATVTYFEDGHPKAHFSSWELFKKFLMDDCLVSYKEIDEKKIFHVNVDFVDGAQQEIKIQYNSNITKAEFLANRKRGYIDIGFGCSVIDVESPSKDAPYVSLKSLLESVVKNSGHPNSDVVSVTLRTEAGSPRCAYKGALLEDYKFETQYFDFEELLLNAKNYGLRQRDEIADGYENDKELFIYIDFNDGTSKELCVEYDDIFWNGRKGLLRGISMEPIHWFNMVELDPQKIDKKYWTNYKTILLGLINKNGNSVKDVKEITIENNENSTTYSSWNECKAFEKQYYIHANNDAEVFDDRIKISFSDDKYIYRTVCYDEFGVVWDPKAEQWDWLEEE